MAVSSVKRKAANAERGSSFEQATFIARELTVDEQKKCKAWSFGPDDFSDALLRLNDQQYKVTFRYDDWAECYGCWLLPSRESINHGLILTGRGSEPVKAFKQMLYKHSVLFEETWPREQETRGRVQYDD